MAPLGPRVVCLSSTGGAEDVFAVCVWSSRLPGAGRIPVCATEPWRCLGTFAASQIPVFPTGRAYRCGLCVCVRHLQHKAYVLGDVLGAVAYGLAARVWSPPGGLFISAR